MNLSPKLDSRDFDNWVECLSVIKATNLLKSIGYQPSFEMINGAIKLLFDLIDPLASYDIVVRWFGAKRPCTISHESIKFLLHYSLPTRTRCSLAITVGLNIM